MRRPVTAALLILGSVSCSLAGLRAGYDPLLVGKAEPPHVDLVVRDPQRSREVPIRVFLPTDKGPAVVVLFSHGLVGEVKIPWLLLTGTRDGSPIARVDATSRLVVFPALPPGGKYELVLDGAEHSAFTERSLPGETGRRNPNHHRAILAVTTAFWDAHLRADPAAREWLDGAGVRGVPMARHGFRLLGAPGRETNFRGRNLRAIRYLGKFISRPIRHRPVCTRFEAARSRLGTVSC
jgi:hypothetical protein